MSDTDEPFVVPPALEGERVDRAIATLTGWTRSEVQSLVREGAVLVEGDPVSKSRRLAAGEVVEITQAPAVAAPPEAEPVPVDVQYEDDDVIVVAKPAGLVVHPGAGHAHGTLVHGLLHRFPDIADVGDPARPGIVHRLDRDTSGLMVVARSQSAYDALVRDLAAHDVERHYLALVAGVPESMRGVIDAPIGRSLRRRQRMAVRESGREARTEFTVRRAFDDVALLECRLETGRTHQIRVHLAAVGHPVVGDGLYGGSRPAVPIGRPFLHAYRLSFTHPRTGERPSFEVTLPPELEAVLERLEEAAGTGEGPEPGLSGGENPKNR